MNIKLHKDKSFLDNNWASKLNYNVSSIIFANTSNLDDNNIINYKTYLTTSIISLNTDATLVQYFDVSVTMTNDAYAYIFVSGETYICVIYSSKNIYLPTNSSSFFSGTKLVGLNSIIINNIYFNKVQNVSSLFSGCTQITQTISSKCFG
jgi:hypothetical protein